MKRILSSLVCLLLFSWFAFGQDVQIRGTITSSEDGNSLPGVYVKIKGTNTGTATDANGKYQLTAPSNATLVFTSIGYQEQEIVLAGQSVVDVVMSQAITEMNEVVVTAIGMSRAKKSLGYAVQDVSGAELSKAKETNIVNSLQGRVSGALITSASGAVGSSSRIVIRGVSSLTGNNQPLFVVDGIPIDNSNFGGTGTDGVNKGSGSSDINPDDIETVTVLKGANASALYGSRASAGVILITTKKGKKGDKLSVDISNTTTFETPLRLPNYQNKYGQGNGGRFEYVNGANGGINDGVDESWGPQLDIGLMIPQFDSPVDPITGVREATPWISHPDNVKNFFDVGHTISSNVSLTGGNEKSSFRLSFTDMRQKGMVPYTDYYRKTLSFNGSSNPVDKLTFSASGSYILANSNNQPGYGYSANNVMQQFSWTGRQVDYELLRQKQRNEDGSIFNWNHNYHNNPYMTLKENKNSIDRNRFMGSAMIKYQFKPWLSAFIRSGGDIYSNAASERRFVGDMDYPNGNYYEDVRIFREFNTDFLISMSKNFNEWSASLNLGGNRMDRRSQRNTGEAPELAIAGVYNLGNSLTTPVVSNYLSLKRINSLYAFGQFGFKNAIFLDYSLRNDWSSTLPKDNNSYLYPSVSLSGVITDLVKMNSDILSFAKVRASWAQVGGDTDPYQLQPTVSFGESWNAGTKRPNLFVPNELPNAELKPQLTESVEVGFDLRFLVDRIRLDVTYYNQKSKNQIVSIPISGASGYLTKVINAGRIDNKGLEVQLGLTPVKTANFKWDINMNWSKNNNEVVELYPGIEQFVLGSYWSTQLLAIPKETYGVLYGYDYERDPDGNVIFYGGLPSQDPTLKELGNVTPDWLAGISNEFTYRNLSASFLIDMRHGGDLYSMTTTWGRYAGALEETLIGREGGVVGKGVMPDGNGGYVPNTVVADAEKFNKESFHNNLASSSIFDASFVKLREIKIGYTFNVKKLPIREFNISAVGRNLAILSTNVPHIDPETAFSNGNVQGFEFGQLPSARSMGFSVGVKF